MRAWNEGKRWHLYFRTFKSPRLFNVLFSVEDLQGDGFIRFTIGFLYRSVQLFMPFPNDKYHFSFDFRLFGHDRKR